jgi:cyclopropane fatty-acyl-phospholipid synthase-like methyltransferase
MDNLSTPIDRNKNPILDRITNHLTKDDSVLEIGSGSGEHINYFASNLINVEWQPSDVSTACIKSSCHKNVLSGLELDMMNKDWYSNIAGTHNIILTINSLHIMPWLGVINFWNGCNTLKNIHTVFIYGPFKINGDFKTDSDAEFEKWLKSRSSQSGLRDLSDIITLASKAGFSLSYNYEMPANNHLLVFQSNK